MDKFFGVATVMTEKTEIYGFEAVTREVPQMQIFVSDSPEKLFKKNCEAVFLSETNADEYAHICMEKRRIYLFASAVAL
jgi:hypothetical protein